MVQRYKLEIFSKLMTFPQGLCTGLGGSLVLFGDILRECRKARQHLSDVSSPLVWLSLPLVGGSIQTDSPAGAGGGMYNIHSRL